MLSDREKAIFLFALKFGLNLTSEAVEATQSGAAPETPGEVRRPRDLEDLARAWTAMTGVALGCTEDTP